MWKTFVPSQPKKNENRIARWVWLVVPEVERAHAHRKLHSIDFIERRRMCEKVKRERGQKEQNSFRHGFLGRRIRLRPRGLRKTRASPYWAAVRSRMRSGPPRRILDTRLASIPATSRPAYRSGWLTASEASTVQ